MQLILFFIDSLNFPETARQYLQFNSFKDGITQLAMSWQVTKNNNPQQRGQQHNHHATIRSGTGTEPHAAAYPAHRLATPDAAVRSHSPPAA